MGQNMGEQGEIKMSGVTETMMHGLRKMAKKLERRSATMAEPNDNTGRALERRGLIESTDSLSGWTYYRLTDSGRALLASNPVSTPQPNVDEGDGK